jgi:hypothetical protein
MHDESAGGVTFFEEFLGILLSEYGAREAKGEQEKGRDGFHGRLRTTRTGIPSLSFVKHALRS